LNGIKPFFNNQKYEINKKKMIHFLLFISFLMVILGTILGLYSYLVEFKSEDGSLKSSLSDSPYFFDLKFFDKNTYNLELFPIIETLLNSIKAGIALVMIFGFPLVNWAILELLIKYRRIKKLQLLIDEYKEKQNKNK